MKNTKKRKFGKKKLKNKIKCIFPSPSSQIDPTYIVAPTQFFTPLPPSQGLFESIVV